MGRFREALAGDRASPRSPRSSGARPRRATSARTPTRQPCRRRSSDAGAGAVSILVDERFGGTLADLRGRASRRARCRCWRRGSFPGARTSSRSCARLGADAVLLLLRDLDDSQARGLMQRPRGSSGSTRWSKRTTPGSSARAVELGADPIGINARDLETFAIDRRAQLELVESAPADRVIVAESAIAARAHGAQAELAGADAVLVGSTLMRADDPAAKLEELISRPLVKVCGLTREEDVAAAAEAGADLAGFVLARRDAASRARGAGRSRTRCSRSPSTWAR